MNAIELVTFITCGMIFAAYLVEVTFWEESRSGVYPLSDKQFKALHQVRSGEEIEIDMLYHLEAIQAYQIGRGVTDYGEQCYRHAFWDRHAYRYWLNRLSLGRLMNPP